MELQNISRAGSVSKRWVSQERDPEVDAARPPDFKDGYRSESESESRCGPIQVGSASRTKRPSAMRTPCFGGISNERW